MEKSLLIELLRSDLKHALTIIKEVTSQNYSSWNQVAESILQRLQPNKNLMMPLTKEVEDLTIALLMRITTKLPSIRFPEPVPHVKEIFKRVRELSLSPIIIDGINEFLLTPDSHFYGRKVDEDIALLKQQLDVFQSYLSKCSDNQKKDVCPTIIHLENSLDSLEFDNMTSGQADREYSLCILDVNGNFIMADRMAESLYDMKQSDLLKQNLFEIMIPFSVHHLKKTMGESIFSSMDGQAKNFSFTIYSQKKSDMTLSVKCEPMKIQEEEYDEDLIIYNKYLQSLSAKAALIDLNFERPEELKKFELSYGFTVNLGNSALLSAKTSSNIKPVILLLVRKNQLPQKFKYSLMKIHDPIIKKNESKLAKNSSRVKSKNKNREKSKQRKSKDSKNESMIEEEAAIETNMVAEN